MHVYINTYTHTSTNTHIGSKSEWLKGDDVPPGIPM